MSNWYRRILEVWKHAKPPRQTTEEVNRRVTEILKRNPNEIVDGRLSFYGLPLPHNQSDDLSPPESPVSLPVIKSRPLDSSGRGLETHEKLQAPSYLQRFDKAMEEHTTGETEDVSMEKMPSNPLRHEGLIKNPEETQAMLKLISGEVSESQLDPILEVKNPDTDQVELSPPEPPLSLPKGVRYQFQTLPVDPKAVSDGDTITVYVSTSEPAVSSSVPKKVKLMYLERAEARKKGNYPEADGLLKEITNSGYRVFNIEGVEFLARKFRIRLKGIDAPESQMPFGKKAQQGLVKIVQRKNLTVLVYGEDQYGRILGDLFCDGIFVQEQMLRNGLAWHYISFDRRIVFAEWEKEARQKRIGLLASSNPEKPWDWRKKNPRQ